MPEIRSSARRRVTGVRLPAAVLSGVAQLLWVAGLAAQQVPRIHDSTSADSIRFDEPPLPGGAAAVFRFLFSGVPQWIQIGGVVVGAMVAAIVATIVWKRRADIITWLSSRSRVAKMALGASVVLGLGVAGAAGAWSWNFMMHDNDFCSSCHVMKSAFGRFQKSEHDKLGCHDCHQQSIFASTKELYYWVLDRPEKIPEHAPVPNRICGECHEQLQADSTWKRIIATAGHAVHFKSDSSKLKDLMCVDCHAQEVHAFKPKSDLACGQSGCHDKLEVRLGEMRNQTGLHCVTCHEFTRSVSESISVDSTRTSLIPAKQECFSCHEMREKLEKRGLDKDPHKANCGACHNPHDQEKAGKAFETCATAGCHANADTLTAFHRGLGRHTLDDCGACHKPHSWKVESTRCIDCHRDIYQDLPRARVRQRAAEESPAPTSAPFVSGGSAVGKVTGGPHADGTGEVLDEALLTLGVAPVPRAHVQVAAADTTTFLHSRHRKVACESCHRSDAVHGQVRIKAPGDCQSCHHAADARSGTCATCHVPSELERAYPVTTTMKISGRAAPLSRALQYLHPQHGKLECTACHVTGDPVKLKTTCAECHTDHHRAQAACTACHEDSRQAHAREAHLGCASCHTASFVAALPPSRQLCLSCHREQQVHKPGQDCEPCHRTGWIRQGGAA